MKLEFSLNENDYLQHQLFTASKSQTVKKERKRSILIISLFCLILGALFYSTNKGTTISLLVFAVATPIFFPFYQRSYYKKHYRKFIIETYKGRLGVICSFNFAADEIEYVSATSESKFKYISIEEIQDYFFLKLKAGGGIIFPKKKIKNIEEFKKQMNLIAVQFNLNQYADLNWKWK